MEDARRRALASAESLHAASRGHGHADARGECEIADNAVSICDGFHKPFDDEIDIRRRAFELLERYADGSGPDFKRFYRMFQLEAQVERHFGLKPFALGAKT